MGVLLDLEPQARVVAALADGTSDEQLSAATPCEEYAVRDLLAHLVGLTAAFRDAGKKELGPTTGTGPNEADLTLGADWRSVLPRQLDELVEAWRRPDAWEGMTQAGGVELPGAVAGLVALNELVLHGWDLARATGQKYGCDEASLRASYDMLAQSADDASRGEIFGPVVDVPDDAPLLDRVVGLGGRDPGWTAG